MDTSPQWMMASPLNEPSRWSRSQDSDATAFGGKSRGGHGHRMRKGANSSVGSLPNVSAPAPQGLRASPKVLPSSTKATPQRAGMPQSQQRGLNRSSSEAMAKPRRLDPLPDAGAGPKMAQTLGPGRGGFLPGPQLAKGRGGNSAVAFQQGQMGIRASSSPSLCRAGVRSASPLAQQASCEDGVDSREASALRSISAAASRISQDLQGILDRVPDEIAVESGLTGEQEHHELSVTALRSISDCTAEVCDKLNKSQQGGWPPALPGDGSETPYDDPVLAKARKIAAMTNKLCDDLQVTCNKLDKSEQEDAEVSSLQEISIVTRKVCMNMMSLQEEGWAAGVLNTVPLDEPGDDELPSMPEARNEAPAVLYASQEPDAEPDAEKVAPREEGRQVKVQAEAADEEDDELSDLVKRVTNYSPDDGFSEAETQRMRTAFNRFKVPDSADLHTDDLSGLLQYLGHVMTDVDGVKQLVKDVTDYDYLDFDEFLTVMQRYLAYERDEFHKTFEKFDEDSSGEISVQELRNLCNTLGFSIMKNMLQEALAVVDKDSNGQLGFEELVTFLAVYRHNEGFTRSEVAELRRSFDRYVSGSDSTGPKMPAENLCDALVMVFGLQIVEHAKHLEKELLSGQGVGKSSLGGSVGGEGIVLYFPEFLIFARRTREAELVKMKQQYPDWQNKVSTLKALKHHGEAIKDRNKASVFAQYDEDNSGTIGEDELRVVLKDKDYTPLRQNIHEVFCEVTGSKQGYGEGRELDFTEFFDFMQIFQQRDGFLKEEVDKMRQVFDRFDDDHSGEINVLELSDLLRHLGYLCTLDEIHEYVEEVDENKSNQLDFREFLHLMRLHREQELEKAKKAFKANQEAAGPDEDDKSERVLDRLKVDAVLEELGHERPAWQKEAESDVVPAKKFLDFDDFVEIVDGCREELVRKQRKKAGFTEQEIENFKEQFNNFDKDLSGMIDVWELQGLLKEFGWAPKTKQDQTALIEKIDVARSAAREAGVTDVSADHSVEISFWVFVQLARMLHTQHDRAEEAQMERLMQELRFTQQEVDEFRRVFKNQAHRQHEDSEDEHDHHHHQHHHHVNSSEEGIPRDQVRRLIRQLGMATTPENRNRLDDKLQTYDEGGVIHFMNFLRLMKWLVDTNMVANK